MQKSFGAPPRARRLLITATTALALVAAALVPLAPATADTVPIKPTEPPSVSADALPTVQINGVVWSQVVVGNTVFAGGEFTSARPAGSPAGSNEVPRSHLLAYDVTTGALITSFAPRINAQVRTLAVSPDGSRLYVGGYFTSINGQTRNRVAAFDVATGALIANFAPSANFYVSSMVASQSTLWFGGKFSAVSGQTRAAAAAVSTTDGSLLPWAPQLASGGTAFGMVLSPDQSKIVIGGNFTSLNGFTTTGYGIGMVSATGSGTPTLTFKVNTVVRNAGVNGSITSLWGDEGGVYGTGYDYGSGANFEGTFRASWKDGTIIWMEDCHGDSYSVFGTNDLVYKAGHPHSCSNVGDFPETSPRSYQHGLAFTEAATGVLKRNTQANYVNFEGKPSPTIVNWYPDFTIGNYTGSNQGPWSVSGDSRYVVYGGEFLRVNNIPQQGLVRFAVKAAAPNEEGPRLFGASVKPTAVASTGTVKLTFPSNYDRDNESLTYQIVRQGTPGVIGQVTGPSRFWNRPSLTYTDTGLSGGREYTYTVIAVDPFGNSRASDPVTVFVTDGATNETPVANFTTATSGTTANFDGTGSVDPDGSISSWQWDFGDGAASAGSTVTHTFASAGTYSVRLTVTDSRGATASTAKNVTVGSVVPPPPAGTLAQDDFARATTGTWGSAPVGGAWARSGSAANFSVADGAGVLTIPTAGLALVSSLPAVRSTSSDLTVRTALQQPVAGGAAYVTVAGRVVGSEEYRARLVFSPTTAGIQLQLQRGATSLKALNLPGTYAPGEQLQVRVQVTGTSPTTIQAKVWRAGTTEPDAWTLSTTDSTASLQTEGSVSLGYYISGSSTGLPRTATFDDLIVSTVQ